jgi:hypothetical protein
VSTALSTNDSCYFYTKVQCYIFVFIYKFFRFLSTDIRKSNKSSSTMVGWGCESRYIDLLNLRLFWFRPILAHSMYTSLGRFDTEANQLLFLPQFIDLDNNCIWGDLFHNTPSDYFKSDQVRSFQREFQRTVVCKGGYKYVLLDACA